MAKIIRFITAGAIKASRVRDVVALTRDICAVHVVALIARTRSQARKKTNIHNTHTHAK